LRSRPQAGSSGLPQKRGLPASEAKLVCIAGTQLGSEYVLTGEEVVVGRSPENAVSIPDNSVSRKHLLLRQTPEGWMASDMASGNGTFINGEPIDEETLLKNGDQISVGDTQLEFISAGEPRQRSERSEGPLRNSRRPRPGRRSLQREQEEAAKKQRFRKLFLVALAAMLVLVGVGVYFKRQADKTEEAIHAQLLVLRKRQQGFEERFQSAKDLIREGKWREAQHVLEELPEEAQWLHDEFQKLRAQAPDFGPEVQVYLKAAEQEVPNQLAMDSAEIALKAKEPALKEASAYLKQVTHTGIRNERLERLRRELHAKTLEKIAAGKALAARTADRDSMVRLKILTDDVLAAEPGQRDAMSLQTIALDAIRHLDSPTSGVKPPPETPWVAVTEKYKAGEVAEAARLAEACAGRQARCQTLQSQLADFVDKNSRIKQLSPREFLALYELDRQLSAGAGSANTPSIVLFAVPALEKAARNARLAGRLGEASGLASSLLKMDAKNATARGIMDEVRAQAQQTYTRAYTLRLTQPEQAERLFKEVAQMLPAEEEYAQKAQNQLRALRRGTVPGEE